MRSSLPLLSLLVCASVLVCANAAPAGFTICNKFAALRPLPWNVGNPAGKRCKCMDLIGFCPRIFAPVCSTSGEVFNNFCLLCFRIASKGYGNLEYWKRAHVHPQTRIASCSR